MSNDYDLKTHDLKAKYLPDYLAQRVAIFARKNFGVDEHSLVQLAREFAIERYGVNHVGDKIYITIVAGSGKYIARLTDWAVEFGEAISKSTTENKYYRKALVTSYNRTWGSVASLDGLDIALYGKADKSLRERARDFKCDRDAYKKVRNYVAGALLVQYDQFQEELIYSWRVHQHGQP